MRPASYPGITESTRGTQRVHVIPCSCESCQNTVEVTICGKPPNHRRSTASPTKGKSGTTTRPPNPSPAPSTATSEVGRYYTDLTVLGPRRIGFWVEHDKTIDALEAIPWQAQRDRKDNR